MIRLRVREGWRGRLHTETGEGEEREYRYYGTETGDARMGGQYCAQKIQTSVDGVLGQEGADLPGRKSEGGRRGRGGSIIAM